ncbi:MAG: SMP-30/gluconolactonase/LRE family protein [Rhizobiaceae bacterium]|nr:SMP-30/gluconolactonase/LRE family protein [Rhizobiaceae bacterium]
MFAPPPEVEAEVFCRVPDTLRNSTKITSWMKIRRGGKTEHSFLEGPCFDRQGNLYLVDLACGRLFCVSPTGDFETVAEYDGEPNGLALDKDGTILIADHQRGLLRFFPETGKIEAELERPLLESFKGLNDLTFSADGTLYFTDQGESGLTDPSGRVYRRTPDGRLSTVLPSGPSPNGIALSPDGGLLYVAMTRANAIWRAPIEHDGTVSRVGNFIQLSGGLAGPDGLAVDRDGNIVVCHNGMGCVWLFSRLGEPLLRIRTPCGLQVTNAAYGDADLRTLFITESASGTILTVRMDVPGLPLFPKAAAD